MSLIKCKECGKEFSGKANTCPNCACPISKSIDNFKDYSKLSRKEKIKVHFYMRNKNVLDSPLQYILHILSLIFFISGFFKIYLFILSIFFFISAKAIENDIKEKYYNSHPQEFDKIIESNGKE